MLGTLRHGNPGDKPEVEVNQALEPNRDNVLPYGERFDRELLNFFIQPLSLTSHCRSAANAADLLLYGPNTGPPTGPISAHQ